jgi:hypothetical protein
MILVFDMVFSPYGRHLTLPIFKQRVSNLIPVHGRNGWKFSRSHGLECLLCLSCWFEIAPSAIVFRSKSQPPVNYSGSTYTMDQ